MNFSTINFLGDKELSLNNYANQQIIFDNQCQCVNISATLCNKPNNDEKINQTVSQTDVCI